MKVGASTSLDKVHRNTKRPPTARQRRIEGLTTRRRILLMAGTHPMYLCPQSGSNFPIGKGRTDG